MNWPLGKLIAFDQDPKQLRMHQTMIVSCSSLWNYRYLKRMLRVAGIDQVNGILADLGVSSHQFDEASRDSLTASMHRSICE